MGSLQVQAPQPVPILPYAEKIMRSKIFQSLQKKTLFLVNKHHLVENFRREARFCHQKLLFRNFDYFWISAFFCQIFKKSGKETKKLISIFFQKPLIF